MILPFKIRTIYLVFALFLAQFLKPFEFPSEESSNGVFVM